MKPSSHWDELRELRDLLTDGPGDREGTALAIAKACGDAPTPAAVARRRSRIWTFPRRLVRAVRRVFERLSGGGQAA